MREIKCLSVAPMCSPWVTTIEASVDAFNKAVNSGKKVVCLFKFVGKKLKFVSNDCVKHYVGAGN